MITAHDLMGPAGAAVILIFAMFSWVLQVTVIEEIPPDICQYHGMFPTLEPHLDMCI